MRLIKIVAVFLLKLYNSLDCANAQQDYPRGSPVRSFFALPELIPGKVKKLDLFDIQGKMLPEVGEHLLMTLRCHSSNAYAAKSLCPLDVPMTHAVLGLAQLVGTITYVADTAAAHAWSGPFVDQKKINDMRGVSTNKCLDLSRRRGVSPVDVFKSLEENTTYVFDDSSLRGIRFGSVSPVMSNTIGGPGC